MKKAHSLQWRKKTHCDTCEIVKSSCLLFLKSKLKKEPQKTADALTKTLALVEFLPEANENVVFNSLMFLRQF